ncbi:MAG: DNA polymerase III subunit epsilon [Arsenophonus sp.]|nr:MAG: DNA polymerase III subunit epsilon [Arsenophonus sp.]
MNKVGLHYEGHNIIEIGAVEVINRCITGKTFHEYIRPNRLIDKEAFRVHGIDDVFLKDKPKFSEIADKFLEFIKNSELIIHNAPFDIGFINYEFSRMSKKLLLIQDQCQVLDTLVMARKLFPGKKNNLNALCERYNIDNSNRMLHGALLDAEILAKIYLEMTKGQKIIDFSKKIENIKNNNKNTNDNLQIDQNNLKLKKVYANSEEINSHINFLKLIEKKNKKKSIWNTILSKNKI